MSFNYTGFNNYRQSQLLTPFGCYSFTPILYYIFKSMATNRKFIFINDGYYHIFNRGIERRITFSNKREFERALDLLYFYQFMKTPIRYSQFIHLSSEKQNINMEAMIES